MATQEQPRRDSANHWVIMVYLAGDNNLADEMVWSLKELADCGGGGKFDVFARFHSRAENLPVLHFDFGKKGAARRRLPAIGQPRKREGVSTQIKRFAEQCLRAVKTDDPEKLRFMLVLCGHSGGTLGRLLDSSSATDVLGVSKVPGILQEVRDGIQNLAGRGKEIDILGMDSCLMSMAEVCCEIEAAGSCVRYLIGSEGFEMNTGWPYRQILGLLNREGDYATKDFVNDIVQEYLNYYADYVLAGASVDLSACNLSRSRRFSLTKALKRLSGALQLGVRDRRVLDAILLAHWRAQSYKWEQYVDLWDFCNLLATDLEAGAEGGGKKPAQPIVQACREINEAIAGREGRFVVASGFKGPAFQHSHGLSIYFPWYGSADNLQEYEALSLPRETGWLDFLKSYLKETRREHRKVANGRLRRAFPLDGSGEFRSGPAHDVRTGPQHNVKTGPGHNPRLDSTLAATMKNPPIFFEATDEELGRHLLASDGEAGE